MLLNFGRFECQLCAFDYYSQLLVFMYLKKKDFATHDDAFNQNSWDLKKLFFKITPVKNLNVYSFQLSNSTLAIYTKKSMISKGENL